jgi:transketolase
VPVKRIGLADTFGESGPDDALLDKYGISVEKTTAAIKALVLERRRGTQA